MNRSALSVAVFGIYMFGQGAMLLVVPALMLEPLGIPVPADAWVRMVGWCLMALGLYYVQAARSDNRPFFRLSAGVRLTQFVVFATMLALGLIPPMVLGVSVIELCSGIWTIAALRSQGASIHAT